MRCHFVVKTDSSGVLELTTVIDSVHKILIRTDLFSNAFDLFQ